MSDIKRILEKMDTMSQAKNKPTGPKFPGYWKGTDPASKAKSKMVGGCEESVIKELHNTAKEKVTEWSLLEKFNKFKEETNNVPNDWAALRASSGPDLPKAELDKQWNATKTPAYTGIDPIVRQRMGMQPATQDEIRAYLDKNPPVVRSGSGAPVTTRSGQAVQSGGQVAAGRAADLASPDRAQAVAKEPAPAAPVASAPVASAPVANIPATPTPVDTAPVASTQVTPVSIPDGNPINVTNTPAVNLPPAAAKQPAADKAPSMPSKTIPGSWQDVWKQNPDLKNPNLIRPGQQIKLPNGTSTTVDKGDTLSSIAKRYREGGYNAGTEVDTTPSQTTAPKPSAPATAPTTPAVTPAEPAAPATKTAAAGTKARPDFLKAPVGYFSDYTKGKDGHWYTDDGKRVIRPDLAQNLEKNAQQTQPKQDKKANPYTSGPGVTSFRESDDEKIGGRYEPDDFDKLVRRLGQKAKEQERRHGAVDIAALAKKLRSLEKKEQTKEQEDPAVNKQDPDSQTTSQTSPQQDPAAVKQQQLDQMQDVSTAKSTMSGLSTVLGSKVNPNALSSAVNKISDGQPLTSPEATSMSALTPLIAKAAESPQSAPALKTALSNAAMLARQGK